MRQQSTQHRAERVAESRHRAAGDAHRPAALCRRKQRRDQSKIIGHNESAARGLQSAEKYQLASALREPCGQRAGRIQNKTGEK